MHTVIEKKASLGERVKRGQRIIVITGIFLGLLRDSERKENRLAECNDLFGLVSDVDALVLPSIVSTKLWDQTVLERVREKLLKGDLCGAAEVLCQQIPFWLRYAKDEMLKFDLQAVMSRVLMSYRLA